MLSDSVPPYYTDGPIRKKSHGSEEFLRFYDYQLKGTILEEGSHPAALILHEQPTIEIGDRIRNLSLCGPSQCTQLSSAQKLRKLCNLSSGKSLSFTRGA
jgi:hypothetical protein